MNGTILTLAAFMTAVGWQGNASKAVDQLASDIPGFVPVVGAIIGLTLISRTRLQPIVVPFISLAVLTTVVRRFPIIEQDVKATYSTLTK